MYGKEEGGEKIMYHIAICDDCKEYISYLKEILQEAKGERDIEFKIYEYSSGEELVRNLNRGINYDLLFLDMRLDRMDGDETARIFRKQFPYTVLVFCSGVKQPTIKSFKATPFRYMLKQQRRQDIVETMKEILDQVDKNRNEPFIMAHYRGTTKMIKLKNILYIENAKRGGKIVVCPRCEEVQYEEKLLVDKKPEELLKELEEFGFALAQSTYLVNMNHIELLHVEDLVFDSGEVLKISRAYKKNFKETFVKRFSDKYI